MQSRFPVRRAAAQSVLLALALASPALACPPSLTVEPAKPGQSGALLIVHAAHGCHPGALSVRGSAEGLVGGVRRSVPLDLVPAAAGDFLVRRQWPEGGAWVLRLVVTEGGGHATVLVSLQSSGAVAVVREPPARGEIRDPTEADVTAMLRSLGAG